MQGLVSEDPSSRRHLLIAVIGYFIDPPHQSNYIFISLKDTILSVNY